MLHVDPGDGHVQTLPAHITHIWDMWHNDGRVAELTMEDQGQDQLFEGIGEVGTDWRYGNELAREEEM